MLLFFLKEGKEMLLFFLKEGKRQRDVVVFLKEDKRQRGRWRGRL